MARAISDRVKRISDRIDKLEELLPKESFTDKNLAVYEAMARLFAFSCFANRDAAVKNGDSRDADQTLAGCKLAVQTMARELMARGSLDVRAVALRVEDCIVPMMPEDIAAMDDFIERARARDERRQSLRVAT